MSLNKHERLEVEASAIIYEQDKKTLSDEDLRLLKDAARNDEVRNLTSKLRLKKSIEDLNRSTTKLMWAQIIIAIVAIIVAIAIAYVFSAK